MSTGHPPYDRAASRSGRLTHEQAVALLEAVATIMGTEGVEEDAPDGPVMPSRMQALVAAMEAVGVDAAVIHAYEQTGILVGEGDEDLWSADDLRRWEAAVAEYGDRPSPAHR